MSVEVFDHFFIGAFGNADFMLGYKLKKFSLIERFEFRSGNAALGAFFGSGFSLSYISAHCADPFLCHSISKLGYSYSG